MNHLVNAQQKQQSQSTDQIKPGLKRNYQKDVVMSVPCDPSLGER
jgi:hypothetical protein